MIETGAKIGEAFVSKNTDNAIEGIGNYCDFPIVLKLEADTRNGKRGYRVAIHMLPMKAQPSHD